MALTTVPIRRRRLLPMVLTAIGVGGLLLAPPAQASTQTRPARSVSVPRDFPTIQAAVDAAAPGDTIKIDRGTYTEEVVIDKDLNVRGAGVGATVIKSPATLTSYGVHLPDGRAMTAIVRVGHGAKVRMSGLTVSGPIPCGVEVTGIQALQAATLELSDARVTGIHADPTTCAPEDASGRAMVFGIPSHIDVDGQRGTTAYGRITRVAVDHYQHAGVTVTGPAAGDVSQVTVANNVIAGGWDIPSFQVGIWISDGAVALVRDNSINGNLCGGPGCGGDPISEGQGIGVFVLNVQAGTRVTGNHLARNEVGINQLFSPGCCSISDNTLIDNRYFGITIQDGDGTTSNNRISGGEVGIGVVADAVDTTGLLRRDRISATSVAPIREIECCGYAATAIVKTH